MKIKNKQIKLLALAIVSPILLNAQSQDYPIRPVEFTDVILQDSFWKPIVERNRLVTIPASFARCESTGRIKNFILAAKKEGKFGTAYPFDDTDIYKTIEGASYSLATHKDPKLDRYLDSLIKIVGDAQEPDGYLYTARTIDPLHPHPWAGKQRWEKERELSHELYNAGHLYEAATAHYLATKKKSLLNIAIKNANLVCKVFGKGKLQVAPGHEIVEMGLVRLYRVTGNEEYLTTAKFFIEARGHYDKYDKKSKDPWKNGSYWQDDKPVTEQDEAEGHAVRAAYLYSAVADLAAMTNDSKLLIAVDSIWKNTVSKKLYVQGSIGARPDGERFGENFELPNATAYNETCAAIANVYWNQRMFLLHGESKYIDVLEKTLYNGLLSGVGLDGASFFYKNAMEIQDPVIYENNGFSSGREQSRSGWFECSCCPTNLVRFLPSLSGYVYAIRKSDVYANLFVQGSARFQIAGSGVQISQRTGYPWNGNIRFTIDPDQPNRFAFRIRIPGWAKGEAVPLGLYHFSEKKMNERVRISINGKNIAYAEENGYAVLDRSWSKGDQIDIVFPYEPKYVKANDRLTDDIGKSALQLGPMMYCAEWVDNKGIVSNITLKPKADIIPVFRPDLLGGIMTLNIKVNAILIANSNKVSTSETDLIAIPYYSWANRGKGEMKVWLPDNIKKVQVITR